MDESQQERQGFRYIVIPYLVFASLWIFLSDALVHFVVDPTLVRRVEVSKDIVFVLATALLLHLLLRREERRRKQTDEALRESEEKYRVFFDNVPVGLGVADMTGKLLAFNKAMLRAGGYSAQEIGRIPNVSDLYFDARDRSRVLERAQRDGLLDAYPIRFRGKDGTPYETLLSLRRVVVSGRSCWLAMVEDVSEREAARERIRLQTSALEAAANGIVITDRTGAVLWANQAFTQLTGYRYEEIARQNMRILASGQHERAFYEELWDTILTGRVWSGRIINRRKDGTLYPEEMTITPVRDESGEITHFVAVKQDRSERDQAEEKLRHLDRMEALGRLAAGIVHDCSNALTAISAHAHFALQATPADNPIAAELEGIQKSVDRASGIIQQLLAFSRQETPQPEIVQLNEVVSDMETMLHRLVDSSIKVTLRLNAEGAWVKADAGQMERVVMNLVMNAVDSMPDGGDLTIWTSAVDLKRKMVTEHGEIPAGSYVVVGVADTGLGMGKEIRSHIFEPFFTTKEKGKGTGLGLSTVYGIVAQSQGYLQVESEVGRGTAIKVFLPRRQASSSASFGT
ncbi:MAG: PAS domain S-box protein [Acidobacteria bacterium]|nr:PAS domain S-box protein [Acidobacteriota bacterium]